MAIKCTYWLILIVLSFCSEAGALQCYQCLDVSNFGNSRSTGHVDPYCESISKFHTATKTCQPGEVCGYVKGKLDVTRTENLLVTKTESPVTLHIRDCIAVAFDTSMGCYRNQYYTDVLNGSLSIRHSLQKMTFDGDVCLCKKNNCKGCGSQSVEIFGVCFPTWALGAIGVVVGLLIILCCCCC
ncbi:unnamed protein product [Owenia fusiformis]|uniref:Uncharacterized protein n=1 Tax=Owenia fusiformis TaxID=6347 RepID=A0A8J1UJQ5_OWEFU|nr:unnamed protein product [Owenia fusiformis]